MKKIKYEKPIVQRLGYDNELAVGACGAGGNHLTDCLAGARANNCTTGGSVGTCTKGTGPPAS
jgi:hypothetical protein